MFRCDHPSGVALIDREPPRPVRILPAGGFFKRGNSRLGTEGTIIDAEWLNMLQEEMCNVVILNRDPVDEDALDKSDRTQLVQTILAISNPGGGSGDGGAGLTEPPNDGRTHSRFRESADPGPPETGEWFPAIPEPPAVPALTAYSRQWNADDNDWEWVVAAGRKLVTSDEPEVFHVGKRTDALIGTGTEADPFRSIQDAIDYVYANIDAAGVGVDIMVGTHRAGNNIAWDGFEVYRRVVNCPPGKFRVLSKVAPDDCQISGTAYGGLAAGCCIYANGGSVNVGGFSFLASGVASIKAEGSRSEITIEAPCIFTSGGNIDHLWAAAGGTIHVNANYTLVAGAADQNHHMHVSQNGMIIYMENFLLTFIGAPNCGVLVMCETGGIALLRYSWRFTGTAIGAGPMRKWYVSSLGVLDVGPMYTCYNGTGAGAGGTTAVVRQPADQMIPGLGPLTQPVWTGGIRLLPLG
jgi:hypothetical protein